jgi:predicted ABC-type ATPase
LSNEKRIIIIAGPNGAGKTTFAREYLPLEVGITTFINADLIAAGLSPFAPELAARRAGRLMLEEIDRCASAGISFAFETTLAGKAYLQRIHQWLADGYRVKLIFLKLSHEEAAIRRVAERVAQGGHSIPPDVIRRRFASGLRHFATLYKPIVDAWQLIDNGGNQPVLLAEGRNR